MLPSLRRVGDSTAAGVFQMNILLTMGRVSLSMDRPNMLGFTPFMNRSLSYLRDSPQAATTDKKLAAWVDLQRLSEKVADVFRRGRGDEVVSLENLEVRKEVDLLSQQFDIWWEHVDKDMVDGKSRAGSRE